jgi:hypothetical protein
MGGEVALAFVEALETRSKIPIRLRLREKGDLQTPVQEHGI